MEALLKILRQNSCITVGVYAVGGIDIFFRVKKCTDGI